MAISYQGSGFTPYPVGAGSASFVMDVPAGTLEDDVFIIHVTTSSNPHTVSSTPSGVSAIFLDQHPTSGSFSVSVYFWRAPAGVIPTTRTFGLLAASDGSVAWAQFRGVHTSDGLAGTPVGAILAVNTNHTIGGVTSDQDNSFIIVGLTKPSSAATASVPSPWTKAVHATGRVGLIAYKGSQAVPGLSGSVRIDTSQSSTAHGYQLALRPAVAVTPAPVASFTATPSVGVAPLAVTFSDTSTGTPTSWAWDFGDGSTSLSQNPTYTYATVGSYTVTLTVTNASGTDPGSSTITVTAAGARDVMVPVNTLGASTAGLTAPANRWVKQALSAAWWTGSQWDAVLSVPGGHAIFTDILGTPIRRALVDDRPSARPDTVFSGGSLYVLRGHATDSRMSVFDGNYTSLVPNAVVPLVTADSDLSPIVLHRTPNGTLWAAVFSGGVVQVCRSLNGGSTWNAPVTVITGLMPTGVVVLETSLTKLVLVAADNGDAVLPHERYVRTIDYTTSNISTGWATETLPAVPASGDDQLAVVARNDVLYVVGKTQNPTTSGEPLIYLAKRTSAGVWTSTTVVPGPDAAGRPTRPSVGTDGTMVWVTYGLVEGSKGAFYRASPIGDLSTWSTAAPIFSGGDYSDGVILPNIPVSVDSGLLLLAHNRATNAIRNSLLPVGTAPPVAATPTLVSAALKAGTLGGAGFAVDAVTTNASSVRLRVVEVITTTTTSGGGGGDGTTSAYPDATTTGVRTGTFLTASGSINVTTNGRVLENLNISGAVSVNADNVIIRNCKITSGGIPIRNYGNNLLVEDVSIDGKGTAVPAIAYNNYTLRRCNIYNLTEGPRIAGGNVLIEDCFIHHVVPYNGNHADVIQQVSGSNTIIRRNNLQCWNPDTSYFGNASFMFGDDSGATRGTIFEDNYCNGGNYTINGGGSGTKTATAIFRRNKFGTNHRYGIKSNIGTGCVWDSTNGYYGLPIPGSYTGTNGSTTTPTTTTTTITYGPPVYSPSVTPTSGASVLTVTGLSPLKDYQWSVEMTNSAAVITTTAALGTVKTLSSGTTPPVDPTEALFKVVRAGAEVSAILYVVRNGVEVLARPTLTRNGLNEVPLKNTAPPA